jgi:pyruvate dehydrogenase E2 component (dihydrolipoamide acetyltransferase)
MNSTFSGEGIHLSQEIDIGVAVAVEDGLVVPVIENCDKLGIKDLSDRIRQAVQSARSGKQLITRPGRFTISNLGMYNIDDFAAIINPPEVGILAVGSIKKQLVVQADNSFCVQDQMKITLSVDHRVVDGVLAAKFLNRIKEILETVQEI